MGCPFCRLFCRKITGNIEENKDDNDTTPPFHGGNRGSNPLGRATNFSIVSTMCSSRCCVAHENKTRFGALFGAFRLRHNQPIVSQNGDVRLRVMTLRSRKLLTDPLPSIPSETRELILGAMDSWLDGEPVWPYARIMAAWGGAFENYRMWRPTEAEMRGDFKLDMDATVNRTLIYSMLRAEWIARFGFCIPCGELLDVCKRLEPVVEVGAGSGFMTRLLRNRGVMVTGSDPMLEPHFPFQHGQYDALQVAAQAKTIVRRRLFRRHAVFCSWPSYGLTWFRQMLKAMSVGQHLIVVREDATGENTAWEYLDANFRHTETIPLPCWHYLHDIGEVWVKKRATASHTR